MYIMIACTTREKLELSFNIYNLDCNDEITLDEVFLSFNSSEAGSNVDDVERMIVD